MGTAVLSAREIASMTFLLTFACGFDSKSCGFALFKGVFAVVTLGQQW